jgi:hypothetical protein
MAKCQPSGQDSRFLADGGLIGEGLARMAKLERRLS